MEATLLSINRRMDKDVVYIYIYIHTHTHTMEYYSDIKKNEILPSAATWMVLEGITLSETGGCLEGKGMGTKQVKGIRDTNLNLLNK